MIVMMMANTPSDRALIRSGELSHGPSTSFIRESVIGNILGYPVKVTTYLLFLSFLVGNTLTKDSSIPVPDSAVLDNSQNPCLHAGKPITWKKKTA